MTPHSSRSMITGTPSYLSPEAIKSGDLVDGRSDIYALGCVGYFLLTGYPVFDGSSIVEICAHHLHTPPQPPSRRSPAVPADLDAMILKCLAKSPEERFIDVGALREALGQSSAEATWSRTDALAWWAARRSAAPPASRPQTLPPEAQTISADLAER
jgi:eukaryotic-like serine/threonine-protein kinase